MEPEIIAALIGLAGGVLGIAIKLLMHIAKLFREGAEDLAVVSTIVTDRRKRSDPRCDAGQRNQHRDTCGRKPTQSTRGCFAWEGEQCQCE